MSEEMTNNEITSVGQESSADPVIRRKKIKSAYGWTGSGMLIQLVLINIVAAIVATIYTPFFMKSYFADRDMSSVSQQEIIEMSAAMSTDTTYAMLANDIGYIVGNVGTFFICIMALGAFKARSVFKKPSFGAADIIFSCAAVLCIQCFSLIVQSIATLIAGASGIPESVTSMFTMDDNIFKTVAVIGYAIILGPITEELFFRGFVLNALSPVSRKFGIVVSALLFGLFHGNFNQIFNGFLLGLLFGYVAVKSGSVVTSMIVHIFGNINAIVIQTISSGENAEMLTTIYMAVTAVIGIAAMIMMIKRNGRIKPYDTITSEFTYELDEDEASTLKMKTLVKCPTVWIVTIIYLGIAVAMAMLANA